MIGDRLELQMESLAKGGDGVSHAPDGRVVFVPLTAPGDKIVAKIVEENRGYLRAELERVVTRSLLRVEPPCAVQQKCGGCPWQQVQMQEQLRAKEDLVHKSLRKVETRFWPLVRAPEELGYRSRARLRVRNGRIGLHAARTHEIVQPSSCLTMSPGLWQALWFAGQKLAPALGEEGTLSGMVTEDGRVHLAVERGKNAKRGEIASLAREIVGQHNVVGIVEGANVLWGERLIELPDGHVTSASGFQQANLAQNERMRAAIAATLQKDAPRVIVELYAGDGNLTRALVGVCERGLAIESDAAACERLRVNLGALGKTGWKVESALSEVAFAAFAGANKRCDAMVLDPPRAGCKDVVPSILKVRPKTIVYVSCDPTTLGRDLEMLCLGGYKCESVTPFDFMPHTDHVEVLAVLRLDEAMRRPSGLHAIIKQEP